MGSAVDFRAMEARDDDLIAFRECFERNTGSRRLDTLRWQYFDNPTEELLVDLAVSDDRIAGIYAVQPAFVRVLGERMLAAQSVDTLVDADFRGRGLFPRMADSVYGRVRERQGAFVYGFPNANSAPGFFDKLGWVSLDPVPFLVRPLRTAFLASKLPLGGWLQRLPDVRIPVFREAPSATQELRPVNEFDSEVENLWRRFSTGVKVTVDRSSQYLRWRLGKPGERYVCLGLFEQTRLVAFCAYKTVDKHGGRVGYVVELLHDPGCHETGAALVRVALRRMAADGADVALSWAFGHSPNAKAYSNAGFVTLPERLRPIELHFGVRPLREPLREVLTDRESWYISYCDSDTV